jgi:3-deoxy-D-manno-octulosonate 8-phosphate phosphatase (KDO 8-P phosphatase)
MSLKKIELVVLDVDGTMTDGGIYMDNNQVESKKFNVKDGMAILLAQSVGIEFMILTGRSCRCVEYRADELNIKYLVQGIRNKLEYIKEFITTYDLSPENIAYVGDDLNDLPTMRYVGISACPIDAVKEVQDVCNYLLPKKGGEGVVRAFIEILLKEKNLWEKAISNLFSTN